MSGHRGGTDDGMIATFVQATCIRYLGHICRLSAKQYEYNKIQVIEVSEKVSPYYYFLYCGFHIADSSPFLNLPNKVGMERITTSQ